MSEMSVFGLYMICISVLCVCIFFKICMYGYGFHDIVWMWLLSVFLGVTPIDFFAACIPSWILSRRLSVLEVKSLSELRRIRCRCALRIRSEVYSVAR